MDDSSAHATLTDGSLTLKLLFRFNADGLIDTVRAEARDRVVDGKTATAPWQGRCWRYAVRWGMRVPQEGEAPAWRRCLSLQTLAGELACAPGSGAVCNGE